ncbi:MAG: PQQ-like beta-propeller repeat protein [Bauldia sp.]|nr:PQQ-like beta-propeller repeat protein [Bauldia sp.]
MALASIFLSSTAGTAQDLSEPVRTIWEVAAPPLRDRTDVSKSFQVVDGAFDPNGVPILLAWDGTRYKLLLTSQREELGEWVELPFSSLLTELVTGPDGAIYVAGRSREAFFLWPNFQTGTNDVFIAQLDSHGEVGWAQSFSPDIDRGTIDDIAILSPGEVVFSATQVPFGQTVLGLASSSGELRWTRTLGVGKGSSVSVFADERILLSVLASDGNVLTPQTYGEDVAAALFGPDGRQIAGVVVRENVSRSLASNSASIAGLALDGEAYVVSDQTSAEVSLAATKIDEDGAIVWAVDGLRDPSRSSARCDPSLSMSDDWLVISCVDSSAAELVLVDRESGAHRSITVPRPGCQTYILKELLVSSLGDGRFSLLGISHIPPFGWAPSCTYFAEIEIR